jgi:hypothetical protein
MGAPTSFYTSCGFNAIRQVLEIRSGRMSSLAHGSQPLRFIEAGNFLTS